jgi:DNA ligase-1
MRLMISWRASAYEEQQECIELAWDQLEANERYLLNKLVSGGFRLRVSTVDLIRALGEVTGLPHHILAIRLAEKWNPGTMTMTWLTDSETLEEDRVKPLPFHPIQTLSPPWSSLGNPADWWMEDVFEGIPIQCICQDETIYLWTTDHQMVTHLFPELEAACKQLPEETVLVGMLFVMENDRPGTQNQIQSRMDCQRVTRKIIEDKPACFLVQDCLVWEGENIQNIPFFQRLQHVESCCSLLDTPVIRCTHVQDVGPDWTLVEEHLATARERQAVGIVLKNRFGHVGGEEITDVWWTKKVDPLMMDMVVLYVESGRSRSSGPFYELTFGLWDTDCFVPVTKTGVGLTDEDMDRIKDHVREHTLERFGPVRQVVPNLVYTIIFDGVNVSLRHKSGITLMAPRIYARKEAMDVAALRPLSDLKKRFTQGF